MVLTGTTRLLAASDCEESRELCVKSCAKYRANCDANGRPSDDCVKEQNRCEASCYEQWRKCSEKKSVSKTDLDLKSIVKIDEKDQQTANVKLGAELRLLPIANY